MSATTKQIRKILRHHNIPTHSGYGGTYTNKAPGETTKRRRIKFWAPSSPAMRESVITACIGAVGPRKVRLHTEFTARGVPVTSVIVECDLV